ncbi:MAG: hypothetical protein ACYTGN_09245 [Planctomycetota bacterium]|jgi:hypothetical protein
MRALIILAVSLSVLLPACGGGGGGGVGGGNLVGGDGVFSDTYYDSDTNFTVTVPAEWEIHADGTFNDADSEALGEIDVADKAGGFHGHVTEDLQAIDDASDTIAVIRDTTTVIDEEAARIIEVTVDPIGSNVPLHEVLVYIDKGDRVVRVAVKAPETLWAQDLEDEIDEIISTISRQDSPVGEMRRSLNQAEYSRENKLVAYFAEQFTDAVLQEDGITRAEILQNEAAIRAEWEAEGDEDLEWKNMRDIYVDGTYLACTIDLKVWDVYPGGMSHRGTNPDRVTFRFERGAWRIDGECPYPTGGQPDPADCYGTNR